MGSSPAKKSKRLDIGSIIELTRDVDIEEGMFEAGHTGIIRDYYGNHAYAVSLAEKYAHRRVFEIFTSDMVVIPMDACKLVKKSSTAPPTAAERAYRRDLLLALRDRFNQLMPVGSTDKLLAFYERSDIPLLMIEVLFVSHFCSYDHLTVLSEEEQSPFHNLALGTLRVLKTSLSSVWLSAVSSVVAEGTEGEKDDWDDDDC